MIRFASEWASPCALLLRGGGFVGRGGLAAGLVVVMTLAAPAQESRPSSNETASRAESRLLADFVYSAGDDTGKKGERETAEDMAVMGKLVDQSVAALYASAEGCGRCHAGIPAWSAKGADSTLLRRAYLDATGTLPPPEVSRAFAFLKSHERSSGEGSFASLATYLEGYGVVYQLEAPAAAEAEEEGQGEAQCPFLTHTPWQRAQLELRGKWKTDQCIECHRAAKEEKGDANVIDAFVRQRLAARYPHQGAWYSRWMALSGIAPHGRSAGTPTRAQLVATLLDVLAENGHNFRHLAPEERVAVAVTFQEGARASLARWMRSSAVTDPNEAGPGSEANGQRPKDEQQGRPDSDNSSAGAGESQSGVGGGARLPHQAGDSAQQRYSPESVGSGVGIFDSDANGRLDLLFRGREGGRLYRNPGDGRFEQAGVGSGEAGQDVGKGGSFFDYDNDGSLDLYVNQGEPTTQELTGDLYMRQRNYAAAVESYEKAIREAVQSAPEGGRAAQRLLYNKLIQALVAANQFDKAKDLIDLLSGGRAKNPEGTKDQGAHATEPTPTLLPARLVVSATKLQLDAVHAGELSREEFATQATVRFMDPNVRGEAGPQRDK